MDDEREHREDPDLSAVWQDMTPDERIALMVAEGETPPAGLAQAAQDLASGPV
jgi:hypothetical protein